MNVQYGVRFLHISYKFTEISTLLAEASAEISKSYKYKGTPYDIYDFTSESFRIPPQSHAFTLTFLFCNFVFFLLQQIQYK
jgi:hypothetical protein